MKKILSILILVLITFGIVGCSDKEYEPKLSELSQVYRSTNNKNVDGSYAILGVESVNRKDDVIEIKTTIPYEYIKYANDNFLACNIIDGKGNQYSDLIIKIEQGESGIGTIIVSGGDINKGDIIRILPYKTNDENYIEYEIK